MPKRTVRLSRGETVKFSDLPGLLAEALHGDEDVRALAELAFEDELKGMVDACALTVRDPLTLGEQSFSLGNVLANSVLTVDDLRPLLESKGIALIIESPESCGETTRGERVHAVDLIQEQSTLWERRQPARLFDGPGFTQETLALTTLSKYEEFETWTPEMAVLLVSGIQAPYPACTEIPGRGAMGLDNCFIMGDHDPFHQARYILELWHSRENPPLRVRPLDFIDWCKTKGIDTTWLHSIEEKALRHRESIQGTLNSVAFPVVLPDLNAVSIGWLSNAIAHALVEIPDDEILTTVRKETPVAPGEWHTEPLTDDDWLRVREICDGNPPSRCSREQFDEWEAPFKTDPRKPSWRLHPIFTFSVEMRSAQERWCSIAVQHTSQIESKVKARQLVLITSAGIEATDMNTGLLRIADARAYLDSCCLRWVDAAVDGPGSGCAKAVGDGAAPNEAPKERRARWLSMVEEEQKFRVRGANNRARAREGQRTGRNIDPSNFNKEVKKARQERRDATRGDEPVPIPTANIPFPVVR